MKIDDFVNAIKGPEDVPVEAVKWMRQRNNLDVEVIQEQLNFNECVSNSLCSPIDGVENWARKDDIPLGYPGWTANWIIGISEKDYNSIGFLSDLFDPKWSTIESRDGRKLFSLTGIHFGSGGSWGKPAHGKKETYLHYYVKFFRDDFPGLRAYCAKAMLKET